MLASWGGVRVNTQRHLHHRGLGGSAPAHRFEEPRSSPPQQAQLTAKMVERGKMVLATMRATIEVLIELSFAKAEEEDDTVAAREVRLFEHSLRRLRVRSSPTGKAPPCGSFSRRRTRSRGTRSTKVLRSRSG